MTAMQLTHRFRLPAPVSEVFEAFSHLERLAPCFPGATVTDVGEDELTGTLAVKLGPVPLLYTGTCRYGERHGGRHRIVVQAQAEDSRGLGTAGAVLTAHLTSRGAATDVEVVTDLQLTGKPARYGTAVVSEVSDKLVDQFSSCLAARLAGGTLAGPVDATPGLDQSTTGGAGQAAPQPLVGPRRARRSAVGAPVPAPPRSRAVALGRRYGPVVAVAAALAWVGARLVRRLS